MEINKILPIGNIEAGASRQIEPAGEKNFGQVLKETLEKVNQLQADADQAMLDMAMGEDIELHEVMILATRANVALEATIAIRNKALDAYQEIMRMQV